MRPRSTTRRLLKWAGLIESDDDRAHRLGLCQLACVWRHTVIRQLRSEVWDYAINTLCGNSDHFATTTPSIAKCPESQLPAVSALLYGAAG